MIMRPLAYTRRGISLLEVLVSIFILAIGISSVFALFLAGRELDARAAVQTRASSYLDRMQPTLLDQWPDIRQWIYWDTSDTESPTRAWADGSNLPLPVIVDPYAFDGVSNLSANWGFNRFAYVDDTVNALQRVTLSEVPQTSSAPGKKLGPEALARDGVLSVLASVDDLELEIPKDDQNGPPRQLYDTAAEESPDTAAEESPALRRKRGTDLTPALFLAQSDSGGPNAVASNVVDAWVLVFHKFPVGLDSSATETWPQGSLRFDAAPVARDWVELTIAGNFIPEDSMSLRRAMAPGKWLLLVAQDSSRWWVHWSKMTSVTSNATGEFEVLLETPYPNLWPSAPTYAFAFDSLVTVSKVATPITIRNN
jgi:type II secretory pathway pseudopilin PulG